MRLISVLDPAVAEKLSARGFSFTKQQLDKSTILFTFAEDEDLMKVLNEQFDKADFIVDDKLRFS